MRPSDGSRRRRVVVAAVGAALTCGAAASGAQARDTVPGTPHADAAESAVIDLSSASLGQRGRELELVVRAARRIVPEALDAARGGELCVSFMPAGAVVSAPRRVCASRAAGGWLLRSGRRAVEGAVAQPRPGTLRVRIDPQALGLPAGPIGWRVFTRAAACPSAPARPPAGSGASGAGGTTGPSPGPAVCEDRAPDRGSFAGRVWRVRLTGCQATGPPEVHRGPPIKQVALSYDDGPAPITASFLDELERLQVPATFFMLGQAVRANAGLLRRMMASGDELANHSWNHANLGGGGPAASSQLERTSAAIERATGFTPCLFRPPYGSTGADLVARSRALGMTSVLWTADPFDWKLPGTGAIVQRVLAQSGDGAIILSHDGGGPRAQTLAALPQIVAGLQRRGYTFVTVSQLLGYRQTLALVR